MAKEIEIHSSLLNDEDFKFVKQSLINISQIDGKQNYRVGVIEYINDSSSAEDDQFFFDMLEFVRFLKPEDDALAYTTPDKLIYLNCPKDKVVKNVRQWDFTYDHECLHQLWDTFGVAERIKEQYGSYNHEILNLASDCVINDYLVYYRKKDIPDGLVTPEWIEQKFGVKYDRKNDTQFSLYVKMKKVADDQKDLMKKLMEDPVIKKLLDDMEKDGKQQNQQGQSGQSGQSGQGGQSNQNSQGKQNGQGQSNSSQGGSGSSDEEIDKMSGDEAAADAQKSADAAKDAADKAAKAAGKSGDEDAKKAADKAKAAAEKSQKAADEAKEAAENGDEGTARKKAKEARDAAKEAEDAAKEAGADTGKGNGKDGDQNSQGEGSEGGDGEGAGGNGHGTGHASNNMETPEDLAKIRKKAAGIIEEYREKISGTFGEFIKKCKKSHELKESGLAVNARKASLGWNQQMNSYVNAYVKKKVFQKKRQWESTYSRIKRGSSFIKYGEPIEPGKKIREEKLTINTAFYIDRSGSMGGEPIKNVFKAAYTIAEALKKQFSKEKVVDTVSFKMYAFDYGMHELKWGNTISADGGTMDFDRILEYIKDHTNDFLINIIITDAQFNINESEVDKFIKDINGMVLFITNSSNSTMKKLSKKYDTQLFYIEADNQFTIKH